MIQTVTRIFEFAYAHHLPEYKGLCCSTHGHNAILEVEISGPPTETSPGYEGMVFDFKRFKNIVEDRILTTLDHEYINNLELIENTQTGSIDWFFNEMIRIPTAENMIRWIFHELNEIFNGNVKRIRLYETSNCYAELKE